MSATIIKTETFECEEAKVGGASGGKLGNIRPKPMVKKIQGAERVQTVGKKLRLRLKEQHATPQIISSTFATPTFKKHNSIKRRIKNALQEFNEDNANKTKSNIKVKRSRYQSPIHYRSRPASPSVSSGLPYTSSKCGEIFVTNNAQKWTFVCIYCQKSTRDIGEFICHLQYKHMAGLYNDHDGENDHSNQEILDQAEDSFNNQDQDVSLSKRMQLLLDLKCTYIY